MTQDKTKPNHFAPALNRRQLLATGTAAIAATSAGGVFLPRFVLAGSEPGPGVMQTFDLGDGVTVSTISDGHLMLPSTFPAPLVEEKDRVEAMAEAGQTGETYKSPINITVIQTPDEVILVDVGSGSRFMPTSGKLGSNLAEAGLDPEAITKVAFTHAHPDHIWGVLDDFDEIAFANASFHIHAAEDDYWRDPATIDTLPEERKAFAVGAKRSLEAITEQLERHGPADEIAPGVSFVDTSGHTPGHVSIRVSSGDKQFMVLGDALTHPVISFQHPDWQTNGDHIKDKGAATRKRVLGELAADKIPFVGYHLPGGGMGTASANGSAFRFEPMA